MPVSFSHYGITDVSDWTIIDEDPPGRNIKYWLVNQRGEEWLFKLPKPLTTEHVSEKLAFEIAKLIGISAAETELAVFKSKAGSISRNFISKECGDNLIELVDFIQESFPQYDPEQMLDEQTGAFYSLEMIIKSVRDKEESLITCILNYMLFDALIGNTDRHHSNWGVIYDDSGSMKMAPSYDHSASLGSKVSSESVSEILRDRRRFRANIDSKAKSLVSFYGRKRPTHKEVLTHIRDNFSNDAMVKAVNSIHDQVNRNNLDAIMKRVPEHIMDEVKKEFVGELILAKKEIILGVFL